jgi:hypothetical protein
MFILEHLCVVVALGQPPISYSDVFVGNARVVFVGQDYILRRVCNPPKAPTVVPSDLASTPVTLSLAAAVGVQSKV